MADAFPSSASIVCSAFCQPVPHLAWNDLYLLKQTALRIFLEGKEKCKQRNGANRHMEWFQMKGEKQNERNKG
jgi:hypothetical protein